MKTFKIVEVHWETLPVTILAHVLQGYEYSCQCGEGYKTAEKAALCRKCNKYIEERKRTYEVFYTKQPDDLQIMPLHATG